MDIVAAIVTHTEPAELMKPTDRSLHHPAIHTQAAAVGRPPLGQLRSIPRFRNFCRSSSSSKPRSPITWSGRFRVAGLPAIGGTASTNGTA